MKSVNVQLRKRVTSMPVTGLLAGALAMVAAPIAFGAEAFTVDPAQSRVAISGNALGAPLEEQGSGSLVTSYGGTLYVELSGGSIQFASGSRLTAKDSGSWQPLPDGSSGSASANYGGKAGDFFTTGVAAARKVEVNVTSGPLPVVNGNFDVQPVTFAVPADASSSLAYQVTGAINKSGAYALAGQTAGGMATTGSLYTVGNQQILTIPVNYTAYFSIASANDTTLVLTGQLVAIRTLTTATPVAQTTNPTKPVLSP